MALRLSPDQNWQKIAEADAGQYYEGNVVKEGSAADRVALTSAKGDEAVGVIVETKTDFKLAAVEAHVAAEKIKYFKLGSGAQVDVKSITGQTYNPGAKIYLDDSVDGQVTATDGGTNRYIGHYPRNVASLTTSTAGQLVPCELDVEQGRATT